MPKTYLRFECGGKLPREGYRKNEDRSFADFARDHGQKPRQRDGRFACVVFATQKCPTRPIMPDGQSAPCFECPAKRRAGYKRTNVWPEPPEDYPSRRPFIVTCYPEEIAADEDAA